MNIKIYDCAKNELDKLIDSSNISKSYIRIFIRTLSF